VFVCTYGVSQGELQAEVKQNAAKATAATEKAVRALRDEVRTAACDWTGLRLTPPPCYAAERLQ